MQPRTQLSLIRSPRVLMRYYPDLQPPEAAGPFDVGTFAAWLAGHPAVRGYGASRDAALKALAEVLLNTAVEQDRRPALSVLDQVLTAAARLSEDAFLSYLGERAETPVLDGRLPARH